MAEMLQAAGELDLLARFDEIEEWPDYAALALEVAAQKPGNDKLRDQIAELAEAKFEGGRELILGIYRRANPPLNTETAASTVPKPEPFKRRQFASDSPKAKAFFENLEGQPKGETEKLVSAALPARSWAARQVPGGASELEALTYIPGLVGEIVEWIVRGARRPNRVMALGVAAAVVGTLVGRRIEGPTESATHLFLIILAPTGYGKDWPLHCGGKLMEAVGAANLLGPHEFASSPGFIKQLKRNPLMVCFVDELGDELSLINNQKGNEFVSKIIGTLKKCYNAWTTIISAEKVSEESEKIDWPAPSIVGAATPERFFEALQPRDLESGFANRLLILPFEGSRRPPEQDAPARADEPPKELVAALGKLPRQTSIGQQILDQPVTGKPSLPRRERMDWGPGASDIYFAFSKKMDRFEETDQQRYELGMRACENAARLATIVAVGRGSRTVGREDIEWAVRVAERSFEAAVGGVDRYMREYFEFPKFCERVLQTIAEHGGWRSRRDLERDFRSNKKHGFELDNVLKQLVAEERIKLELRPASRGPSSGGYRLVDGEGNVVTKLEAV